MPLEHPLRSLDHWDIGPRTAGYKETMAKDHGSSVKNDKQYEGLRKKGMSKGRAAAISNANAGSGNEASKKGGRKSGGGSSGGGSKKQKAAAGREGGKKSS